MRGRPTFEVTLIARSCWSSSNVCEVCVFDRSLSNGMSGPARGVRLFQPSDNRIVPNSCTIEARFAPQRRVGLVLAGSALAAIVPLHIASATILTFDEQRDAATMSIVGPTTSGGVVPLDYGDDVVRWTRDPWCAVGRFATRGTPRESRVSQPVARVGEKRGQVRMARTGVSTFDAGLAQFKSGDYRGALASFDLALQELPGDPVVHEVCALALFALGDYRTCAAALNSFLSSAPGMDWTTMSGLYGNTDDYTSQLRTLERYCQSNSDDPSSHFVLAYHYLALGEKEAAIQALETVVENQPQDSTAKRMLDALAPPPPAAASKVKQAVTDNSAPETDLVGEWRARAGDTTIDLAITEDSQFVWKATQTGKPTVELRGDLTSTRDELVLASGDQGTMAGSVKSLGPDAWQFSLSGAPPSDPGLSFARVRN